MDWQQRSVDEKQVIEESSAYSQPSTLVTPYTKNYWRSFISSDYALNE